MDTIEKILPWKNNNWIKVTSEASNKFDPWGDFSYQMELTDLSSKTISKIKLNEARGYFDIIPILSKNIIVVGYFNYTQNDSYVMVDLYNLSDITNEFGLQYQYKVKSEYSCGNTTGKICTCGYETFYLIWTDIYNSDHFSCFEFDLDANLDSKPNKTDDNLVIKIKFTENIDSSWDNIFMISPDNLIYARALGHNSNQIELALFDASKSHCFSMSTITLPNNIDHYSNENMDIKVEEFDTMIYDFFCFGSKSKSNVYCLIRIKTYYKSDPLHIQNYFIDTIVQVDGADSKPVEISNPIYFSTSLDYGGYFGKRPYWIKQLDLEGNTIVKIFNESMVIK